MPTFKVWPLLPGESLDELCTSKTAPRATAVVGFESKTGKTGIATVNARRAITPRSTPRREETTVKRTIPIKGYDPETGELEDGEVQVPIWQWSPAQWAMFLAALSAFITTLVTLFAGNPIGIPGAG